MVNSWSNMAVDSGGSGGNCNLSILTLITSVTLKMTVTSTVTVRVTFVTSPFSTYLS